MNIVRRAPVRRLLAGTALLLACHSFAHDEDIGARFVHMEGVNTEDCLDHHEPCASIQYALEAAEPGNTVKVAAGIYDMTGVPPESFLFGTIKAAGGYRAEEDDHDDEHEHDEDEEHEHNEQYAIANPDLNKTILVGVDPSYRQAMKKQGFKWAADYASAVAGLIDDSPAEALQSTQLVAANCVQGVAGQFPCQNVDFQAQIALNQFSSQPASAANIWGFVDLNDNREYAVIGLRNGTAVVEVTDPVNPRQVATIQGNSSSWREVKIYQHFDNAAGRYRAYAYVSTEAPGSGVQVINLSGLPNSVSLATTLTDTGSQHTLYVANVDYSTNVALPGAQAFLYVAGANVNSGAWRIYSLANPAQPQLVTPAPIGTQYMHDSTSLYITDSRTSQCAPNHNPCEVLVDFNENTVDLWDVTDKALPVRLSSTTYPTANYTHSGWPSADQRFLFFHDELEEIQRGLSTQMYTMNLDNLRQPTIVTSYQGPTTTTDHNGYTKGNFYYVSHYRRGLVVFDVSNPNQMREVASFDTFLAPAANSSGTDGAWGVYPFFPSGTVVISDITNGLFVLKDNAAALSQNVGRIGFVGTSVGVSENRGLATVSVQRSGGSAGAVSIQYGTSDDTANAGSDYTTTTGTLTWAAGDVSVKSFTVPISNDTQTESGEAFRVTLTGASGGATIDGSATISVAIVDDDSAGGGNRGGGGGGGAIGMLLLWPLLMLSVGARRRVMKVKG